MADDMSDVELGGDMGDDFVNDIEADMGGDESASGGKENPLGREERD